MGARSMDASIFHKIRKGYWDYQLLSDLMRNGCYFLCRIKSNAVINIVGVSNNAPQYKLLGRDLFDFNWKRRRQDIIEVLGSFCSSGEELFQARVIGFWNPSSSSYHWYTTNLIVPAKLIYPAYRLRWQVELLFKSAKGSLRLEDIPSTNHNIIWNLVLSSLIASLITQPLARTLAEEEASLEKKQTISFQRAASLLIHVADEFRTCIIEYTRSALVELKRKLGLFIGDLFDPNYNSRQSTIGLVMASSRI